MMRVLSALVFLWLSAFAAVAQAIDFAEFDRFAGSVETSLANERLPDSGFEALRASLVEWRETMLDGQDANAVQIEALEAQLDALGPVPAEGETEEPGLALVHWRQLSRKPKLRWCRPFPAKGTGHGFCNGWPLRPSCLDWRFS